jgi:hypothetical protein
LSAVVKELRELTFLQSQGDNYAVSSSNTDHGHCILAELSQSHRIIVVDDLEGPSVLSTELINEARALKDRENPHEKVLVSLYTPDLMKIIGELDPRLSLVNSEYFQWLHSSSGHVRCHLKPDLFTAHHSLVTFLPPYQNALECAGGRHFGKFLNWGCRASIHCIWDCKWKIDVDAFGQKVKYLQLVGGSNKIPLRLKGILFDVDGFWMINSIGTSILDVQKCRLDQKGSRKAMMDFLTVTTDPWNEATEALCERWGVTIPDFRTKVFTEYDVEPVSAILGAGAHGRVFKLENDTRVMKVVVGDDSDGVELEYKVMLGINNSDDALLRVAVFPVVEDTFLSGFTLDGIKYAGYLMAAEGERIPSPVSDANLNKLATSLFQLHNASVPHGDPRVANALLHEGRVKWIDFRASEADVTQVNMTRDVKILLGSLNNKLVPYVSPQIEEYIKVPTVQKLFEILKMHVGEA